MSFSSKRRLLGSLTEVGRKPENCVTFLSLIYMSNHKSHINTNKKTCTLAKHFIEQKCGLQNLKVTLIEKVKVKNLDYLEDREGHWQRQLFTMQPHGLNVRKEFEGGTHKSFFKYY